MSLANKFGIPESLLDAAKKALEEANEYQKKVQAHMAKKGIKSLNDLTADQKKKFFNDLDSMHKAKNEEVEPVEEAQSSQAKTTMKHINNPTAGEKKAAKDIKPGVAGYRDRIAMLHSAKARGALKKEEVELTQEDLDFIASLNQDEVVEGQLRNFSPHSDLAGRGRLSGYNKTAAGKKREYDRETERLKDKMKYTKSQGGIAGPKGKLPEEFELDDFTVEEIEEYMQTEEFSQLDELSNSALERYVRAKERKTNYNPKVKDRFQMKKAAARVAARDDGKSYATHPVPKAYHDQHAAYKKERGELEKKHSEKIDKVRGDESAVKKQVKKTHKDIAALKKKHGVTTSEDFTPEDFTLEDFTLEDFTLEEIEEYMQTEEFSQLDELSKETLGNYIKKRQHDVAAQGAITRQHAVDAEKAKKENNYTQQRKSNERSDKAFAKGWNYRQNISRAVDKIVNKG